MSLTKKRAGIFEIEEIAEEWRQKALIFRLERILEAGG
jgi:hypothetical protein